jgi:hypothetical protein
MPEIRHEVDESRLRCSSTYQRALAVVRPLISKSALDPPM